jgi:FKBP-type peptidyl-prolyl cis-trans isomerase
MDRGNSLFQRRRKRCFVNSSSLGYGTARGPIPGGSVLVFDIKLIKVN